LRRSGDAYTCETKGRQQTAAILSLARAYGGKPDVRLVSLCANIGVRESWHYSGLYKVTDEDILTGRAFDDAIGYCTFPVDIHKADGTILVKNLDGTHREISRNGVKESRWLAAGASAAKFWQIPFLTMLVKEHANLLFAGRMLDAEQGAFSAMRVMVSLNQMGEAAGAAACMALNEPRGLHGVDAGRLRQSLKCMGACIVS